MRFLCLRNIRHFVWSFCGTIPDCCMGFSVAGCEGTDGHSVSLLAVFCLWCVYVCVVYVCMYVWCMCGVCVCVSACKWYVCCICQPRYTTSTVESRWTILTYSRERGLIHPMVIRPSVHPSIHSSTHPSPSPRWLGWVGEVERACI